MSSTPTVLGRMAELDEEALLDAMEEALRVSSSWEEEGPPWPGGFRLRPDGRAPDLYERAEPAPMPAPPPPGGPGHRSGPRPPTSIPTWPPLAVHYLAGAADPRGRWTSLGRGGGAGRFAYEEAAQHWEGGPGAARTAPAAGGPARLLERLGDLKYTTASTPRAASPAWSEPSGSTRARASPERVAQVHSRFGRDLATIPGHHRCPPGPGPSPDRRRRSCQVTGPLRPRLRGLRAGRPLIWGRCGPRTVSPPPARPWSSPTAPSPTASAVSAWPSEATISPRGRPDEGLLFWSGPGNGPPCLSLPRRRFLGHLDRRGLSSASATQTRREPWCSRELDSPAWPRPGDRLLRLPLARAHVQAGEMPMAGRWRRSRSPPGSHLLPGLRGRALGQARPLGPASRRGAGRGNRKKDGRTIGASFLATLKRLRATPSPPSRS